MQDALTAGWGFLDPHRHMPLPGAQPAEGQGHTLLPLYLDPLVICRALAKHNPRCHITGLGLLLEERWQIWRKNGHLRHMA